MKNCTSRARFATLSLALGTALSAHAQLQLKEQVVTASRVATPVTDVIADVSIIDRAMLELAGQSSIRDLLAQQAGVQMVSSGSYRSNTAIFFVVR